MYIYIKYLYTIHIYIYSRQRTYKGDAQEGTHTADCSVRVTYMSDAMKDKTPPAT